MSLRLACAVRSVAVAARPLPRSRMLSTLSESLYTAHTSSSGSRAAGTAQTKEGNIKIKTEMPKELGGSGKVQDGVSNPEQLFGMAYANCFLSALAASHGNLNKGKKPLGKDTTVNALVHIGKDAQGAPGFRLAVELEVLKAPLANVGLSESDMNELVKAAHELCPYSRATKNNVEVEIRLV